MVPVVPRVPRYQWYHGTTWYWYRYLVRIFTFFFYSHISFCTCIGIGCLRMKELSMAPFAGSKTSFSSHVSLHFSLIKILGIFLLCILLSPHELYVLFVFLNRTIVPKSYQNQSVLVYITTSIYIYTVYVYILSITSRE
jgi:hypothetical protein